MHSESKTPKYTERNKGLRKLLSSPIIYEALQSLVGSSRKARQWFLSEHIRAEPGMTVVDVGCGPGRFRKELPESLDYFGFDPSAAYIATAKKSGGDGEYLMGTMTDFMKTHGEALAGKVDLVTCNGVLHHVDRAEMDEILESSLRLLSPGGRFTAIDPVFLAWQDAASRWIIGQDRGTSILTDLEWRELLDRHFPRASVRITTRLTKIPYTHALLTGWVE